MNPHTATPEDRPLHTPADAARLAKVSRKTIYREVERGELRALHAGRQLRIDPGDFAHYLERGGS
jgi:excisionase family DNA binding protein